jgi:hypothetical protein
MRVRTVVALAGASAVAVAGTAGGAAAGAGTAGAAAAGAGPAVSVKVQTPHQTLLNATGVHGGQGWITKGGTPRGKCPAASAAGALNSATHGKWTGKYYASVPGIFVESILGHAPGKNHFWELVVNGRVAQKGICDIKLSSNERLLFKVAK